MVSAPKFQLKLGFYDDWYGDHPMRRCFSITNLSMSGTLDAFVLESRKNERCLTLRDLLAFVKDNCGDKTAGVFFFKDKLYNIVQAKALKRQKIAVLMLQQVDPVEEKPESVAESLRNGCLGRMFGEDFWL